MAALDGAVVWSSDQLEFTTAQETIMTSTINPAAFAKRWQELYNDAVDRMVIECYAENCEVTAMGGPTFKGRETLAKVEQAVLQAAPTRWMRVDAVYGERENVVVEATLLESAKGGAWSVPFCAILTIANGQIVRDHTYADWSKWPGLSN
jgi:ketosteroid isomerase-like protein